MDEDVSRRTRTYLASLALRTAAETLAIVQATAEWRWTCFCACWVVIGDDKLHRSIDSTAVVNSAHSVGWEWSMDEGFRDPDDRVVCTHCGYDGHGYHICPGYPGEAQF